MYLLIDNKGGVPIYEQICSQIKEQITEGLLLPDSALPSIRNLAKDLRISVITTKRAYDELEREGYIYTVAGKGCFVATCSSELIREENLKKLEGYIEEILILKKICLLSTDDIIDMIKTLSEENK